LAGPYRAAAAGTAGWIVGLQLAALVLQGTSSPQGRTDVSGFIAAFGGSHYHVLEYLTEAVVRRQVESVQRLLMQKV